MAKSANASQGATQTAQQKRRSAAAASTKNAKKSKSIDDEDFSAPESESNASDDEADEEEAQPTDEEDEEDQNDDDDGSVIIEDDDNVAPVFKKGNKAAGKKKFLAKDGSSGKQEALNEQLPPIIALTDIFADLVGKVQDDMVKVCDKLDGRKLRVGTMCSGTESPLLALGIISKALEELTDGQSKLGIEHIFSCEIEPFKQAYIERNFAPPLLFRDVTELGGKKARTAYGGLAEVPGGIDILVAGTSCVDYSPLNVSKKGIDAKGESGRTFFGMLDYVKKNKPPIVILENVSGAPWDEVVKKFKTIKYVANFLRLDTKQYYIPHTRARGYLIAVPKKSGPRIVQDWEARMRELARPCSSPLEAFLLETDDPRIVGARQELSIIKQNKDGVKRAGPDWIKCEARHAQAREQEDLGSERPLTLWQDNGGPPRMPDGAWNDWAAAQTERVLDLMDISVLRLAKKGTDVNYKSAIWNLSQNVDRTTGSIKLGVCPCLTPNMIPYLASRGGPIVGLEALALQGLPIDELLLTRESTDQLADLAGNAMSSTVVGTAIVAALSLAWKTLRKNPEELGSDDEESEEEAEASEVEDDSESDDEDVVMKDAAAVAVVEKAAAVNVADRIRGPERLHEHKIDLASFEVPSDELLQRANSSARKCICEGRTAVSDSSIKVCSDCGHSSCSKCADRPKHSYKDDTTTERIAPEVFEAELKQVLPMRISLAGFDVKTLAEKTASLIAADVPVNETAVATAYFKAIVDGVDGHEFHFQRVTRRKHWIATFVAEGARLEFEIASSGYEWRLFVTPAASLAVASPIRKLLNAPAARLRVPVGSKHLLDGEWDISVPLRMEESLTISIETVGDLTSSWRADLGLLDFQKEKRPAKIRITGSAKCDSLLDCSIDGEYELKKGCGTANNALHRRTGGPEESPLFFFLDPSRSGEPDHDPFVFASSCDRLEFAEHRTLVAALDTAWREPTVEGTETVKIKLDSTWSPLTGSKIVHNAVEQADSSFSTLSTTFDLEADKGACSFADCLLSAKVKQDAPSKKLVWAQPEWHEVDLHHEGPEVFSKIAWMLSRIPDWEAFKKWQTIPGELHSNCTTCCPPAPTIHWIRKTEQKAKTVQTSVIAVEDGRQAADFEQALKSRPSPIVVHTRQVGDSFEFNVGLNAATLTHKALAALPRHFLSSFAVADPVVAWRLKTSNGVQLRYNRSSATATFNLPNNRADEQADQPPHFKVVKLRPEQLRSLKWMIGQENDPKPWVEEEVAEAVLPKLGWHAEAKATREVTVRGGVLADEVGYGKTAIILGLISSQLENISLPDDKDRIAVKATLIVVPSQLSKQWPTEIKKFAPGLKVITLSNMTHLKSKTISDFQEADIVVIADTVFNSDVYWPQLGDWSASSRGIKPDANANRYFRTCVDEALDALPAQIQRLQGEKGAKQVLAAINSSREKRREMVDIVDAPSKRLKGQAAIDARERAVAAAKNGKAPPKVKAPPKPKAVKAVKAVDADPWALGTSSVRSDWTEMKAPPLAIFSFNRIVIDEFTYSNGHQLAAIHSIRAASRWILSGTPPIRSFTEIKTIANLLHVHLGVDDEGESAGAKSASYKEKTEAERFHSFRDVHTAGWHDRRDEVAQRFLDQYARQNLAEIDEIEYEEEIVKVELPAAEMAIYRELEHHLLALAADLGKIQKIKKDKQGDREVRLSEALGDSATPEEALIKRCSHFSLDMDEETAALGDAPHVCDKILSKRVAQLEDCHTQMVEVMRTTAAQHLWLERNSFYKGEVGGKNADTRHFLNFLAGIHGKMQDEEATTVMRQMAIDVSCEGGVVRTPPKSAPEPQNMTEFLKKNGAGSKKVTDDEFRKAKMWHLRTNVSTLDRIRKELIGRYRSKRYFEGVRNAQRGSKDQSWEGVSLLSCCGHQGPHEELKAAAVRGKCIAETCDARVGTTNIVKGESLGNDTPSGNFGVKLETLVTLIEDIPKKDRILVFVQFDDLFNKVKEALESYGITTTSFQGGATKKSSTLESFQNPKDTSHRVMLLKVTDSSAAGANLTIANWAFFISPLLTDSKAQYKAYETQAIGRLRRFGQMKKVKVFRLLTASTIDIAVFEERTGLNVEDVLETQTERKILPKERKIIDGYVPQAAVKKAQRATKAKPAAKGKGKGKATATSDDQEDDEEAEAVETEASDDDEEKEAVATDGESDASVKPKKKQATKAAASKPKKASPKPPSKPKAAPKAAVKPTSKKGSSQAAPGKVFGQGWSKGSIFAKMGGTSSSAAAPSSFSAKASTSNAGKRQPVVDSDSGSEVQIDEDDDEPVVQRSPRKKRASAAATIVIDDSSDEDQPVVAKKRKPVIADSEDDDDEVPTAAPVSSKKRAAVDSPAQASPSAKRSKFVGVVIPPPSPAAKKASASQKLREQEQDRATPADSTSTSAKASASPREASTTATTPQPDIATPDPQDDDIAMEEA